MFTRIREDIRAIKERDPAARSAWEVMTLYPGFHAIQIQRFAHWCWQRGLRWFGRAILESAVAARREEAAARIGFSAYAISADMDDPMVQAIHRLLDHAVSSEERLNKLIERLKQKGVPCADLRDADVQFDPKQVNRLLG